MNTNRKKYLVEYREKNKEQKKLYLKEYREKNKDKIKEYREKNKEHKKECDKEYRENNKDKIKEYQKEYYENNKDKLKEYIKDYHKEYRKEYREKNKDKIREYIHKKYKTDILFKFKQSVRNLISYSFKLRNAIKRSITVEILGCSFEFFKDYIEQQFEPWMNWENKGKYNGEFKFGWDIDHIIPQSKAITEQDIIKLNHYTNLRPLCSKINRDIKIDKTKKEERIYKLNIINKILQKNNH